MRVLQIIPWHVSCSFDEGDDREVTSVDLRRFILKLRTAFEERGDLQVELKPEGI
ncbi:hypothetical protein HQ587_06005 [bacterium]|nr:hypothetical protein [bacterium]